MRALHLRNAAWVIGLGVMCAACGGQRRVTRTDAQSTQGGDLSGCWNDIDANLVAKELIAQCAMSPWASNFQSDNAGRRPVVKLMGVRKRTGDRMVNVDFFAKRLERQLLDSGRARVVAAYGQEGVNVRERARQAVHADDATAKSQGAEVGADFTLQTIVNAQNESDGQGRSVRAYLVNMELVNVETNEKVWIGEKRIRKVVENVDQTCGPEGPPPGAKVRPSPRSPRAKKRPPSSAAKLPETSAFGSATPIPGALVGRIYMLEKRTRKLPDFEAMRAVGKIYATAIDIAPRRFDAGFPGVTDRFEWFGVRYDGFFEVSKSGTYTFRLESDDGANLYIDGRRVVDNDGVHPPRRAQGSVRLEPGRHAIRLDYFQGPRYQVALRLWMTAPGEREQIFRLTD